MRALFVFVMALLGAHALRKRDELNLLVLTEANGFVHRMFLHRPLRLPLIKAMEMMNRKLISLYRSRS